MKDIRQVIINKLKYLRKHWKDLLQMLYPNSHESYKQDYQNFISNIQRIHNVEVPVYSSNGQDLLELRVNEVSKETLQGFLNEVPDDAWIQVRETVDYEGYSDYIMQATTYQRETLENWNQRLGLLVRDLETYIYNKEFPVTRSDNEDLNKYIEYLESRIK